MAKKWSYQTRQKHTDFQDSWRSGRANRERGAFGRMGFQRMCPAAYSFSAKNCDALLITLGVFIMKK